MGTRTLVTGGSGFIGSRVVDELTSAGREVLNLDVKPPQKPVHRTAWRKTDLVDGAAVAAAFAEFRPDEVVHMAARTDTLGTSLAEYQANIDGTDRLIETIERGPHPPSRVIFFSTQFVHQQSYAPSHDEDYAPHTFYGESKIANERSIRAAHLPCPWVIVRPTNIWGPWHPRYPTEFWRVLKKGLYVHPGRERTMRSYGYVGTVADQVIAMLAAPVETIDRQVFYVGDPPLVLLDWVNGFSRALNGHDVVVVPRAAVRAIALVGDVVTGAGLRFPITSSRFASMTTDNPAPMDKTVATFGPSRWTLEAGIAETVDWLVSQDPDFWAPRRPLRQTPMEAR